MCSQLVVAVVRSAAGVLDIRGVHDGIAVHFGYVVANDPDGHVSFPFYAKTGFSPKPVL